VKNPHAAPTQKSGATDRLPNQSPRTNEGSSIEDRAAPGNHPPTLASEPAPPQLASGTIAPVAMWVSAPILPAYVTWRRRSGAARAQATL